MLLIFIEKHYLQGKENHSLLLTGYFSSFNTTEHEDKVRLREKKNAADLNYKPFSQSPITVNPISMDYI